jgi:hypothetical protein
MCLRTINGLMLLLVAKLTFASALAGDSQGTEGLQPITNY